MKPAKDQNKPKKPMTSFLFFLEEYREKKSKGLTGPDVAKQAGIEWRSISDDEKKKYKMMQEKADEKYKKEMKDYLEKVNDDS